MLVSLIFAAISSLSVQTTTVHGWTGLASVRFTAHSSGTTWKQRATSTLISHSLQPPMLMEDIVTTTTIKPGSSCCATRTASTSSTLASSCSSSAFPNHFHILILPGFGTRSEDYTRDDSLAPNLVNRGWKEDQVHVLPVSRIDWMNALVLGACDGDYLKGMATPLSAAYLWYIHRVADEIRKIDEQVKKEANGNSNAKAKIILVGHSAGGWLARYVSFLPTNYRIEHFCSKYSLI